MTYLKLSDETRIRYSKRGSGSEVFVLVHGWRQSHRLFDKVIQELSQNHTVLAFDQRGMGESDKPDSEYDFQLLSSDLAEILQYFSLQNVTLVGWSMGCTTSLSYLANHEDRVKRVALLNGPLRLTRTQDFKHALSNEKLEKYIDQLENFWPAHERIWYSDSLLPENLYLVDLLLQIGFQTPLDVALKLVREQAKVDHRQTIKNLRIPILAIYSQFDPYWPVGLGEWIATNANRGSLVILEHSSHCAPLEESTNLSKVLIDFIKVA